MTPTADRRNAVTIIGAGFGGICMGIKLRRAGIPFTIVEKEDRVGGVWRDNTYPGAACDIPSHLYSYSFEPSHDWSRKYGTQPEIQSYIDHCAHEYDVIEHVRFGKAVQRALGTGTSPAAAARCPALGTARRSLAPTKSEAPRTGPKPMTGGSDGNFYHSASASVRMSRRIAS